MRSVTLFNLFDELNALETLTSQKLFERCLQHEELCKLVLNSESLVNKLGGYNSSACFQICENSPTGTPPQESLALVAGEYWKRLAEKWSSAKQIILEKYSDRLHPIDHEKLKNPESSDSQRTSCGYGCSV